MATETFPASFGQERLWILDRLEGAGATYHVPLVVEMDRGCDATALERALNYVIERHESLRTTFVADAHGVRQAVHDELRVAIHQVDLSGSDELSWKQRAASDIAHPFDLAHGPLIRATLYRLDGGHCVLLVVLHHIIVDGWSEDVLLRDLAAAYGGTTGQLSSLPIQYADFAVWQRDTVEADERDEHGHRHFWRERLAGTTPTQLPVDWLTTPDERFAGRRHNITVDPNLTSDIRGFLRSEQATLFLTGLTAFAVTAGRYASCQDVLVATPVAGRDRAELRDLIGFFVNTLPVRIHLAPDDTSPALLASVKRMLQETLDHAEYPFERIVQALPTSERRLSPVNLLFGLVPPPGTHGVEHGWRRAKADAELLSGTAKFDLLLFLVDEGSTLRVVIEHSVAFEAETIMAIGATYLRVLSEMVRHSDRRLRDWQIVAREDGPGRRPAEGAAVAFRVDQEFDSQASRTPDAPAVVADHRTLTYRELRQAAEAVAQRIRHATESAVVALLTERTAGDVIAMLGILKAGAAYLPIDPSWPDLRIDTMFAEAGVKAIVGSRAARNFGADLVWIDPHAEGTFTSPLERPAATGHELAYVIMTSGSTGRPKGVAVEHANIAQLVVRPGYVSLGPSERILHLAPGAFDAATFEIWAPLLNGGTVVVAPTTTPSFSELGDLIRSAGITTMWLTASFFNAVIDSRPAVLAPVRQLLIGGEALSVSHVRRALASLPNTRLINGYGPTETTTFASTYAIPRDVDERWRSIPIGTPLRETSVFVIDDYGHPAPHGARGMLYIGGGGVSRGYLNRPEATAEAFLTGVIPDAPHMRVYRTGDEVRRRADGNLEFLGRRDGQVKLRGMRIELGEIESELRAHPDVADAAVVVAGEHPVERLVAYLVPRVMTEMIPDPRPRLATRLPAFMIPASIIVVPSLPRTYQGKLDRGALPETEAVARTADLPVSPTECRLAELWSALLGTPQVGRHDNFFALGGHSLLAARMSFQVLQQFGADVPIDRFYRDASLAAIAARIDEALATNAPDDRIVRRPRPARRLDT